jgi:hypothetical protein
MHPVEHLIFLGSLEVPWDKVFGSFHDGTIEADARIRERRKRIMGQ